jgi:hypothetical protein
MLLQLTRGGRLCYYLHRFYADHDVTAGGSLMTVNDANSCVEHSIWTPVPVPPPAPGRFTLRLADLDRTEHERIEETGRMVFHVLGCSGHDTDHRPQNAVAAAMARQANGSESAPAFSGPSAPASFLYHLGDIAYKDDDPDDQTGSDQQDMYNEQFYQPYSGYSRPIFAIPGNHDGKFSLHERRCAIEHFLSNFCAPHAGVSADNITDSRPAMRQPYLYWRLDTPLAYIVGLYANIANGGMLDDPHRPELRPQYHWLVAQMADIRARNAAHARRKAVLLAVHYPPYSGAADFLQRGDPTLGPTRAAYARPLGMVLQQAFRASGQRPDAVLSAHAHLYQRLTYIYSDGWEVPYLIVGSGGHTPVEQLWRRCDQSMAAPQELPCAATFPPGLTLPPRDRVQLVAFDDRRFGFVRLTLTESALRGEFFAVYPGAPKRTDSFTLDLRTHQVTATPNAVARSEPADE